MLAEFEANGLLVQRRAAFRIREEFGEEFVYRNKRHHWAIRQVVLDAFRALTTDAVVWSRSRQLWRRRRDADPPGARLVG